MSLASLKRATEILVKGGSDVNTREGVFGSALQAAASMGHESIVRKGAKVNMQGEVLVSTLYAASSKGYDNTVQLLLEQGANMQ